MECALSGMNASIKAIQFEYTIVSASLANADKVFLVRFDKISGGKFRVAVSVKHINIPFYENEDYIPESREPSLVDAYYTLVKALRLNPKYK